MIYEFAVDPNVFRSWEDVRYITEHFGVSEGRLISRFPKKWERMVYQLFEHADDNTHMRVVEKLADTKTKMQTRVHEWDDNLQWFVNAEREHAKRPFHAILTSENPGEKDYVLDYKELDDRHPLWHVERERIVQRTAEDLAAAVAPLLKISRIIIFVDPHFDPYKAKAVNGLRAYLNASVRRRLSGKALERVEFHTLFKPEIRGFRDECTRRLPTCLPAGMVLTIRRLSPLPTGDGMHNRYILTDRGGVRLAWGLDEGNASQTDDISLLSPSVFLARWEQYCGEASAFECVETIEVTGTRT